MPFLSLKTLFSNDVLPVFLPKFQEAEETDIDNDESQHAGDRNEALPLPNYASADSNYRRQKTVLDVETATSLSTKACTDAEAAPLISTKAKVNCEANNGTPDDDEDDTSDADPANVSFV